jgi:3-oxoadipate enol-lactonase
MPKIEANGIQINYEIQGKGQPLVLIAGLGYGLWQWHKVVPGLAQHFQVVTFDNRGAGQSDKPDGPYSAALLAEDTAALIENLNLAPAIVLGHSMGGFVAQQLALTRPDLIKTLVLSATNFGGPNHVPVTQEALAVMMNQSGDPVDVARRGLAIACAPGFAEAHPDVIDEVVVYKGTQPVTPESYQAQMAVGLGLVSAEAAFEGKLGAITIPTVVFTGAEDRVVPPANVELLAREIPNATTYVMSGVGHHYYFEAPERFVNILVELLK